MNENDCPDCERLNVINERIRKLAYIVPTSAGDAVKQLKADAEWMAAQLRGFQQWAARVVALQDHVEALTAATRAESPAQIVAERAERVRQEYDGLFGPGKPPKEGA
jgi:hypothetical protein